jgi:hypothetical protein
MTNSPARTGSTPIPDVMRAILVASGVVAGALLFTPGAAQADGPLPVVPISSDLADRGSDILGNDTVPILSGSQLGPVSKADGGSDILGNDTVPILSGRQLVLQRHSTGDAYR